MLFSLAGSFHFARVCVRVRTRTHTARIGSDRTGRDIDLCTQRSNTLPHRSAARKGLPPRQQFCSIRRRARLCSRALAIVFALVRQRRITASDNWNHERGAPHRTGTARRSLGLGRLCLIDGGRKQWASALTLRVASTQGGRSKQTLVLALTPSYRPCRASRPPSERAQERPLAREQCGRLNGRPARLELIALASVCSFL